MRPSLRTAEHALRAVRRRITNNAVLLVAFLGLFAVQAFAQDATIVGTVTDRTGAAVPNVDITATQVETGVSRQAHTNPDGQYILPNLGIGTYTLAVNAPGFRRIEQKDVRLQVGDRARLDFKLEVGSTQEQVTVEATAVAVQTDSGEVSDVITGKQVEQIATNGRSIYTLVNLTTGASSLQSDFQTPTPVGGDANVSFNGNRPAHNLYMLDGGENLDRGGSGTFSVMPSLEAIAEFRALTSNYSAEYGLSSAATMTSVLKSGTKQFHGSLWEFVRNDAFDARNYFNPAPNPQAKLRFNTYGFNVGGQVPWGKSKPTFFFYNMEWRKLRQGGTYNQEVPLTSTYGGNFAGTNINIHTPCASQVSAAQAARFAGAGLALSECDASGNVTNAVAFPNNAIPASLLDANAQSLLNAGIFPAPTNGTKFQGSPSTPTDVREEIVRIDHEFNKKFSVFGHWISEQIAQGFGTTMWSSDNVPTVGNIFGNPSYSAVVHVTSMISNQLLNEASFNYNGNRINITPTGTYTLPSDFTQNRVFTGPNALDRIPSISLANTGTNYTSNWVPWVNKADSYQLRDDLSWALGTHQLKLGGSWELYKKAQNLFAPTQGAFTFNGAFTGNDFADFLLGYAQSYGENAVQDTGHWNNYSIGLYVQDNWRATKRLTLNLGLRWDGIPHTYEANDRMSNFYQSMYNPALAPIFLDPNTISPNSPGLGSSPNPILNGYQFYLNGIGIAGQPGVPKGLVNNHWAAFGPRIGFAFDVTGQGKTVIRGGFGTMYERVQGNDMYNAGANQPFSGSITLNNVLLSNPKTGIGTGSTITTPPAPILVGNITGLNISQYKLPVSYQYSIGVQQEIWKNSVLSATYVGTQNRHQSDYREIALPDQSLLPSLVGNSANYNELVAYPGFHSIRLAQNEANAHYNSLQLSLRSQATHGLTLEFGYTLSRSIDPTTGGGNGFDLDNVSNPYVGWRYDIGPSPFDRTHVAFVNFVYDLPFFQKNPNRFVRTVAGGWQLSGVVSMVSGAPLNITYTSNNVSSIVPNSTNRPDLTGPIKYPHTVDQWFDTSAFSAPAPGTWGNLGHDALRGPGRQNWNLSLFKSFVFSESRGSRLEFRTDAFNVWNHTQLRGDVQGGGISTALGSSNFGQVTAAYDPRTLQLGVRLIF